MGNISLSVCLLGLDKADKRLLELVFVHSREREFSYNTVSLLDQPQLLIVNADDKMGLAEWRGYRSALKGKQQEPPVLIISSAETLYEGYHHLQRPMLCSKLIAKLDELVKLNRIILKSPHIKQEQAISQLEQAGNNFLTIQKKDNSRALIVDDSLPVRIQIHMALEPFVSKIDFAENGEEAFELAEKHDYDIIFLDIVLPNMDGYEVCGKIKAGRAKDTPVIMLTGNSSPEDHIKGKLSGCDTYLIKPVSRAIFNTVVSRFLW